MVVATDLGVTVTFLAADEPFNSEQSRDETVGQFKPKVLKFFGLVEGADGDGNTVIYTLFHDKTPLENPQQPLGDIAGPHAEHLKLKLSQQITQG